MGTLNATEQTALTALTNGLLYVAPNLLRLSPIRNAVVHRIESLLMDSLRRTRSQPQGAPGVDEDSTLLGLAMVHSLDRALAEQRFSQATMRAVLQTVTQKMLIEKGDRPARESFKARYGSYPPGLLLVSPGKGCNLHCTGCYADSGTTPAKLDWDVFDRVVTEAKTEWGTHFFAISGGEPLAYRSKGKGILDMAEKHSDCYFMMYTNGTLIDDEVVARLASIGNLSPALSLEGWREQTDGRRGSGVFDKVIAAMDRLRDAGVLYGISLTPTRQNCDEILSDAFLDFCYQEHGALYGWMFQYMPIGRSFTFDLMLTPEQRLRMWHRSWELVRDRRLFLADFWNQGTVTRGCIAAGRYSGGGYMCVDWNGFVAPCVFMPYSPVNINDVYAQGKTLSDAWAEPFLAGVRNWQKQYDEAHGNLMMPCPMRDHHADLRRILAEHEPEPVDENARAALLDPEYAHRLAEYDATYEQISAPLWQEHYMRPRAPSDGDIPPLPDLAQTASVVRS